MIILTKIVDGNTIELGRFEKDSDGFDLMMRDFLKEVELENIPQYIDEDFVGVELENLKDLIARYEIYTEYGYDDGDGNSLFLSKGLSNYYWKLSYEE